LAEQSSSEWQLAAGSWQLAEFEEPAGSGQSEVAGSEQLASGGVPETSWWLTAVSGLDAEFI
jgi:hypothetical protein